MKNLQKTYLRYQEEANKNGEETKASTPGEHSYEKQDTSAFIKNEREQAFYKEMFL